MASPSAEVAPAGGDPPDPGPSDVPAGPEPPPAPRPRLGVLRRGVRETGLALITAGVVLLLFVGYQLFGTGIAEAHSQSALKKGFNTAVAGKPTGDSPTVGAGGGYAGPSAPPGGAIDHLVIPKLGVDKFVVEGISEEDLRRGPGHYPQTALPGQNGNAAIAGHRTTYGAPFFRLNEMKVGDVIYITDLQNRRWVYKVSRPPLVVSPDDVSVLDPTPYAQLTLTTCNPRFSATSRLIVIARLAGQVPLPVTHTLTLGATAPLALDNLGSGNRSAWPAALGYGAVVLVLWILTRLAINRTRRWARAGAYAGGIALCLLPLWFCFENAALLLPQNF